ncbi:MAG: glucose-1-phosphate adenylyltransferase [Chlamydiia bacterium]|nr:glucose-1-phosphate adenylyltransferase [Chlamydiia bacterium]
MAPSKGFQLTDRVACIILAGGKGTRLFPLTKHRCKPGVNFGGRYRLIDVPISNALNSKMNHIYVISQYFSSSLNKHIKETYPLDHFQGGSINLLTPEERSEGKIWYEGTADAVRKNLEILTKTPADYFLILSGDQLYNMDLEAMVQFAHDRDADLTIAALPVDQTSAPRLGLLSIDSNSNITGFQEKPKDPEVLKRFQLSDDFIKNHDILCMDPPCYLASMGIYVFKKETLISLLEEDPGHDFGKHMIPAHLKEKKASAFLYQGYWEDIGTIASYYEANLALTTNSLGLNFYNEVLPIYAHNHHLPGARITETKIMESVICDGAILEAEEVTHSIIGVRSVVRKGTIIRSSILLGNHSFSKSDDATFSYEIGENCYIEKAIIDQNVRIGNHVSLKNEKGLETYDGDGIYIRDGIIIVTSKATIPDHFTL